MSEVFFDFKDNSSIFPHIFCYLYLLLERRVKQDIQVVQRFAQN